MASLEVIRAYKALNLNELPEFLSIKQIAKLYYPANDKTDDRECIEEYIQTAIDSGSVQISSGEISKGDTSKTMQIANVVILPDAKPSEHTLEEWIEFFNGLDCRASKAYCFYGYQTHRAILKERLSNGCPSKWDLITRSGSIYEYSLIPLISSSHYEAWTDKPEPTEGSLISGWLGIAQQAEAVGDVGAVSDTGGVPTSAKSIKASSNEFSFSGLLHKPSDVDDWFEVIDVMTKAFYVKNEAMPTKAQAWAELCTNTPIGYGIESKGNQSLTMPGVAKEFNKRSFDRRWAKYTAKSNPFKPN